MELTNLVLIFFISVYMSLPSYGYSVVAQAKESPCVQVTEKVHTVTAVLDFLTLGMLGNFSCFLLSYKLC